MRNAPADGGPRVHPDSGLTRKQAEELHRMLDERRRSLTGEVTEHLNIGRFSVERVTEPEEAAALAASQATMIDLAEAERTLLRQIERALAKFEAGTYGISEESGEPIGFDRLRAIPWAALSASDQEVREREARSRGRWP